MTQAIRLHVTGGPERKQRFALVATTDESHVHERNAEDQARNVWLVRSTASWGNCAVCKLVQTLAAFSQSCNANGYYRAGSDGRKDCVSSWRSASSTTALRDAAATYR